MSRRKSSVLLPFNATASRIGHLSSYAENVTQTRSKKTPKRRRTQVDILEPEIDEDGLETCEDMRGKLWNIYRVADLNNFNYKKQTTFPRYGRVLSRYLVESFTEAVTLKATFLLKSDYQGIENNDPPIQIKVEDVQFSQPRLVYEGILLSAYDSGDTKREGTVRLPLLLARGSKAVRDKVHECLVTVFSSAIHEVPFPEEEMRWMIAAWSGDIHETKTSNEVVFLYAIPSRNDTIKCQYSVNFIKKLRNSIHDPKSRLLELSEVNRFHASLVKHTQKTIGLNLATIPLVMYKTPDFELHSTGKVKIKTTEFIPRILNFIAEMCEINPSVNFYPT